MAFAVENILDQVVAYLIDLDDEEEVVPRRPRFLRERADYFTDLDEVDFRTRFRLSKVCALQVLGLIEHLHDAVCINL